MNMANKNEFIAFYEKYYQVKIHKSFLPGEKTYLGNQENQKCRFCGGTKPDVSVRKEAHAIPEAIGNKSLFTRYECDTCNQAFGLGCENDFGNWSLPMRTISRICGKSGIPTIKQGPNGIFRVEGHPEGLNLSVDEADGFLENDGGNQLLKLHLRRGPYRPQMVVKALIKMALSIVPEDEIPNFQQAIEWIRPNNTTTMMVAPTPFIYTFVSGPVTNDRITIAILTRNNDEFVVPYSFLILRYGHEMLQIAIPSPERDVQHYAKKMEIKPFPILDNTNGNNQQNTISRSLSFHTEAFVRDEKISLEFLYDQKKRR